MPRLENWAIVQDSSNPFLAPECRKIYLEGEIYDDEKGRFNDGDPVSTSSIQELDIKNNVARTKNTVYTLGRPEPEYIKYLESIGKTLEDYM